MFTLTTTQDTVFKKNTTAPSASIDSAYKLPVKKGQEYTVLATATAKHNHIRVTFATEIGHQKWNTWTVFSDHVYITRNREVQFEDMSNSKHPKSISEEGLQLIKYFEGFRSDAYVCPAGVLTIGYGSTENVYLGQTITEEEAETLLKKECIRFENAVKKAITVPLNQNEFDALVSFTYNVGENAMRSSTMRKLLNQNDRVGAMDALSWWVKDGNGHVLPGLVKRRKEEAILFLMDN